MIFWFLYIGFGFGLFGLRLIKKKGIHYRFRDFLFDVICFQCFGIVLIAMGVPMYNPNTDSYADDDAVFRMVLGSILLVIGFAVTYLFVVLRERKSPDA